MLTTGSQGEPMSGLSRMAFAEHRKLEIRESDMVIISATPIPGNEKSVSRVINQLFRIGANVIYESLAEVHVSGHARQEELKLMHSLVQSEVLHSRPRRVSPSAPSRQSGQGTGHARGQRAHLRNRRRD